MSRPMTPFNLSLLVPTEADIAPLRPVTVLDIFEGKSRQFHPDGLFSIETFGKIGSETRNRRFSYIDMKAPIYHPVVYKALSNLKGFYTEILKGTGYAIWNEKAHDFVKVSAAEGQTGYHFFEQHFKDLEFENRPSIRRKILIDLIDKYRKNAQIRYLVVLPAGLRDFEFNEQGKPVDSELNGFYRPILSLSNLILPELFKQDPQDYDATRTRLQLQFNKLYDYLESLLSGKKKLVLGKWAGRKVFNGTRNVITSLNNDTEVLHSRTTVSFNETTIGLYQFLKASLPVSIYRIRTTYLEQIFTSQTAPYQLVDPKTLLRVEFPPEPGVFDQWVTSEGLERLIQRYSIVELRHEPITINDHYLGLIYKGPGVVRFMRDISELPEDKDPKDVYPITLCEFLYLCVFQKAHDYPLFFTRHPVINYGSIYPSLVFLKTTVESEVRVLLDEQWHPTDQVCLQFPVRGSEFVDTMSPHPSHTARLGADFDGDTATGNIVYTDQAVAEVHKLLKSRRYYIGPNGKINFSATTDTINYVLGSMTG